MSLQEELKKKYPHEVALAGGRKVSIRPMVCGDRDALATFFKGIELEERRLFKDDVTDLNVIQKWCDRLEYMRILPLVAVDGDKIVADATLHRSMVNARSHLGYIRLSVHKDYRAIGLGKALIKEICAVAPAMGIAIVDAELMPEQKLALKLFEDCDFVAVATLPQHTRDLTHKFHDLIVLTHVSVQPEDLSPDAQIDLDHVDLGGGG